MRDYIEQDDRSVRINMNAKLENEEKITRRYLRNYSGHQSRIYIFVLFV